MKQEMEVSASRVKCWIIAGDQYHGLALEAVAAR